MVVIDPRRKTIVNVEEVVGDLKVDTTAIESEVEIIRSKEIVLQVIDQLDLRTDSEFHGPTLVQSLLATLGLGRPRHRRRRRRSPAIRRWCATRSRPHSSTA